jgi:hypothetical protein
MFTGPGREATGREGARAGEPEGAAERAMTETAMTETKGCLRCLVPLAICDGDWCDQCQPIADAVADLKRGLILMREGRTIDGMRVVGQVLARLDSEADRASALTSR